MFYLKVPTFITLLKYLYVGYVVIKIANSCKKSAKKWPEKYALKEAVFNNLCSISQRDSDYLKISPGHNPSLLRKSP
jgi:hypothetical protein